MNKLDTDYQNLLKDILENGIEKSDRTGTGTISVFGRQIRHKMSDGFPILTTKRVHFKSVVSELLWFLKGETQLKWLLDHNNTIWVGDSYQFYLNNYSKDLGDGKYESLGSDIKWVSDDEWPNGKAIAYTKEEFINKIKTDDEFAKKWGELGPIYGAQWRSWVRKTTRDEKIVEPGVYETYIDQIANLINDLKTNPDSRRLIVSAWNVGELHEMVLPPCHYGFQVYTRELSLVEMIRLAKYENEEEIIKRRKENITQISERLLKDNIPTRAISLMFNMRSCDVPLGLPFNIASYGLLLTLLGKLTNMIPDELIGNLGDTHIYKNQIDGVKEQIGSNLSLEERINYWFNNKKPNRDVVDWFDTLSESEKLKYLYECGIPFKSRSPYPLPKLNINTEFWPTESGECGIGNIDANSWLGGLNDWNFVKCLIEEDIQLVDYQYHPPIKFPLSN